MNRAVYPPEPLHSRTSKIPRRRRGSRHGYRQFPPCSRGARSHLATVVAFAVVAYAGSDMVHEVLGHGLACALSPTVRALSLSTVALQTDSSSRLVAAAGSIANIVVGLIAAALFCRRSDFDTKGYFLGLFATTNLLNGTGYLLFSGLLDVGDWAVVIAGREPYWIWCCAIALGGAVLYALVVRSAALQVIALVQRGLIAREEPSRLLFPAYITAGCSSSSAQRSIR